MAHDEQGAGAEAQPEWDVSGEHTMRGGQHFGRWWVAERATLTDEGVGVEHVFYGFQPGRPDVVMIDGIEAAREFATQLLAAIDYADDVTGVDKIAIPGQPSGPCG